MPEKNSTWTPQDPVIELRGAHVVHKSRTGSLLRPDKVHAVNDVSLTVRRGETLGLVGESGCGKSTTARLMVGLQAPTAGEVYFKGRRLGHRASDRRALGRSVSMVFQDPATALNPRMVVHDTLIDPLNVHGVGSPREREAKVRDLLHLVGLPPSALDVLQHVQGAGRQAYQVEQVTDLGLALPGAADAVDVERVNERVVHDHAGVERRGRVLEDHGDRAPQGPAVGRPVPQPPALEVDLARGRRLEPHHEAGGGGLPAPRLPHQAEGLAAAHGQGDVVDRVDLVGPQEAAGA